MERRNRKQVLMAKRMMLMLGVVLLIVAALGYFKVRQVQALMAVYAAYQPPPEAVTTIVARQERWPSTMTAVGTVAAVRGVTVSADLPGIIERIAFDSGKAVSEGDLLVELDTRQERAQLTAAEAKRDLARANRDRSRSLLDERIVSQAEFDAADAEYKSAEADAAEIRAAIARKTIRAPFSGVLGIRQINPGQYVSAGSAIVPLQSLSPIYVNFAVPQQDVAVLKPGTEVRASVETGGRQLTGRVTAIDSVIDPATRNVQIQATFANPDSSLRPGMFVRATVAIGDSRSVIALPGSAINYAPYGDSVFVVARLKDSKGKTYQGVREQFVKVGSARGDQVAVVAGVQAGEEVVTSGVFKLRNNAAIQINNDVQPSNNPAPLVEDR